MALTSAFCSFWINVANLTGGCICGFQRRWDCFIAATRTFSHRCSLNFFRSEWVQIKGINSVIPISTAFSKNHSIRSLLLVGAMAMLMFCVGFL